MQACRRKQNAQAVGLTNQSRRSTQFGEVDMDRMRVGLVAALGVIAIAVLVGIAIFGPASSCGSYQGSPTAGFQFVGSVKDLQSIFGTQDTDCRRALVGGLKGTTRADLFVFIPLYALFIAGFAALIDGRTGLLNLFLGGALAATLVGDVMETFTQLMILEDIDNEMPRLAIMYLGNLLKVFGLAGVLVAVGYALWSRKSSFERAIAVLLGLCAVMRVGAFAFMFLRPLAPLSALVAYLVMLACLLGWFRRLPRRETVSETGS